MNEELIILKKKVGRLYAERDDIRGKIDALKLKLEAIEYAISLIEGPNGKSVKKRSLPEVIFGCLRDAPNGLLSNDLFRKINNELQTPKTSFQATLWRLKKQGRIRYSNDKYFHNDHYRAHPPHIL